MEIIHINTSSERNEWQPMVIERQKSIDGKVRQIKFFLIIMILLKFIGLQ